MQTRNREADDFIGTENFSEMIDFPTEEELFAALDASLEQSPWLPRPAPMALDITSRDLAQHWRAIADVNWNVMTNTSDDHYLGSWMEEQVTLPELTIEPDFLAAFARFLLDRLLLRTWEMQQAQELLSAELAKFRA